jgi:hypothetical protein
VSKYMNNEPQTAKAFGTLAVMGVFTGRVLEEHGFGRIHEVMDHLYPGIMTMGVAAMAEQAAAEIGRQVPGALPWTEGDDWRDYGRRAVAALGPTLNIIGPHRVTTEEADAAFDAMGKRIRP